MPSGSKKRKAAKKKNKLNQSHGHGLDDSKHLEEGRNITNLTSENVVRVDSELTIEEEKPDKKDDIFEHDETDKGSSRSSSNNSNSSDAESHSIKSSRAAVDISPVIASSTLEPKECESNDHEIHFEIPEMLLVRGPHSVLRTTSWKGCCGLFEVFAGSGK